MKKLANNLKQLGNKKMKYSSLPKETKLEVFKNKYSKTNYLIPFICNEFTTIFIFSRSEITVNFTKM
ncbi:MAG: hypothetical protein KAS78_02400 [Candidatus Pacebacteria bacterium]|nr:hypothetical protein [Candidatus Paceibacterota bacterium]